MSWRFAPIPDCPSCSRNGITVAMKGPLSINRMISDRQVDFLEDIYVCPFCGAFAVHNRQTRKLHLHQRQRGVYIPRPDVDNKERQT
jgi:hypothetical protein